MRTTVFPPHRQSVEHDCGEHTDCSGLKEDVACSDRESAFAMTRLERRTKNQRVEMTAMICREHERPVCRQFLAARDCESMSDREVNSQQRKACLLRHAFEQTALASHAAKPLGRSQPSITRRLQLPRFHWHHPRRRFAAAPRRRSRQNNPRSETPPARPESGCQNDLTIRRDRE